MEPTDRREFIRTMALGSTLAAAGVATGAVGPAPALDAFSWQHAPVPLPFAPGRLAGLSEKLIQSHWENNYGGSVRALNAVRGRLAQALADRDLPPYIYNGLKREQLLRTGSVVLHELYFANLGGVGSAGATLRTRVAAAFGSYDRWEAEFRRIALGLAGGSGWVMLGMNRHLGLLENHWMADHATAPVDVAPLLVLDMYEHAFAIDFGAAAARYVDAFFANIQWEAVQSRLEALV